eukprot:CAMPEP_0171501200 /NCGR_PEP_ID=MMETSP0958-20121227/9425_1 /TAXON_ID=87120 /ORGANISM="Aurantiochytrium limacinum, Strain ATCCMYA-1381" /LENGTH=118 /DNA_ID=CAMNT_0012035987 /DNA_START=666 /DNA_END=1023 /DNA_ORIENTATION=+
MCQHIPREEIGQQAPPLHNKSIGQTIKDFTGEGKRLDTAKTLNKNNAGVTQAKEPKQKGTDYDRHACSRSIAKYELWPRLQNYKDAVEGGYSSSPRRGHKTLTDLTATANGVNVCASR